MSFWNKKITGNTDSSSLTSQEANKVDQAKTGSKSETPSLPDGIKAGAKNDNLKNSNIKNYSRSEETNEAIKQETMTDDSSFNKVRSALSAGTVIQGKLSFDTPVRIDGKLSGEIYSSKVLIVGETAQISAEVKASSLIIMGKLTGTITATERVHLAATAEVEANIICPSLIIESGAKFNGSSQMPQNAQEAVKNKQGITNIYTNDSLELSGMMSDKKPEISNNAGNDALNGKSVNGKSVSSQTIV